MESSNHSTSEIIPEVYDILKKYLDKEYGCDGYIYKVENATKKGDNYMGVVYRLKIELKNKSGGKCQLILKVPPQDLTRRNTFFSRFVFLREALAFEVFFPLICDFQKSKDLTLEESFHEYPTSRFCNVEDMKEAICMNDLQPLEFTLHDRFVPLTYDQVAIVMRVYGKLHAISLAIKDQCPDRLKALQGVEDLFYHQRNDQALNNYFESLKGDVLKCVDKNAEPMYWSKLDAYFSSGTIFKLLLDILNTSSDDQYAVMCHGDCWMNNILFKMQNEKIVDICLIDWQLLRYASPISDLMYFLMSCTTRAFRAKHFQGMLNIYYKSAAEHIKRLGSDPNKLYSRAAFELEFKKKGAIGLLLAIFVLPILTAKVENAPDLETLSKRVANGETLHMGETGVAGNSATLFNERMHDVIIDIIDYDLI